MQAETYKPYPPPRKYGDSITLEDVIRSRQIEAKAAGLPEDTFINAEKDNADGIEDISKFLSALVSYGPARGSHSSLYMLFNRKYICNTVIAKILQLEKGYWYVYSMGDDTSDVWTALEYACECAAHDEFRKYIELSMTVPRTHMINFVNNFLYNLYNILDGFWGGALNIGVGCCKLIMRNVEILLEYYPETIPTFLASLVEYDFPAMETLLNGMPTNYIEIYSQIPENFDSDPDFYDEDSMEYKTYANQWRSILYYYQDKYGKLGK